MNEVGTNLPGDYLGSSGNAATICRDLKLKSAKESHRLNKSIPGRTFRKRNAINSPYSRNGLNKGTACETRDVLVDKDTGEVTDTTGKGVNTFSDMSLEQFNVLSGGLPGKQMEDSKSSPGSEGSNIRQANERPGSDSPDLNNDEPETTQTEPWTSPVYPQESEVIADAYMDHMVDGLKHLVLTDRAKGLLETGLQGDVEVDTNAIYLELRDMVDSPVQGIMEANRLGTIGHLYEAAGTTIRAILADVFSPLMTPASKVKFLEVLLTKVKTLEDIPANRSPGGVPIRPRRGESMEWSKETVTVNMSSRGKRTKMDRELGHGGVRPGEGFEP